MFDHIVAAIDDDSVRRGRVIEATTQIAQGRRASVVVVHIRELDRPTSSGRPTALVEPGIPHLEDESMANALVQESVQALASAGIEVRGLVRQGGGSTAKELLQVAEENEADLVVVGDRGAHVTDLLLGGVAHRIVHGAPCPVLLVR